MRTVLALALLALLSGPGRAQAAACRYDGTLDEALVLVMAVHCPAEVTAGRFLDASMLPFLVVTDLTGTPLTTRSRIVLPSAPGGGTGLRYRLDLLAYGRAEDSSDTARALGQSVLAVGSSWLMQPQAPRDLSLSIAVTPAPGLDFASALSVEDGRRVILAGAVWAMGYSAFGRIARHAVALPGRDGAEATIDVALLDGDFGLPRPRLLAWIARQAQAVGDFYGGFPPPAMLLAVMPRSGRAGVGFGRTMGAGGVSVAIAVGNRSTVEGLNDDWVLVHELIHAGMPYIFADWLMEGAAVYFEPIARARAGLRSEASVWREWVENMPRGLPAMTGSGLDGGDHAATYWGGALFWLLADLELRERSGGRVGAEDCVRALSRRIGDASARIPFGPVVPLCDGITNGDTFARLVAGHVTRGSPVDLTALWRDLGIRPEGDRGLALDDAAPRAWVRRAIVPGRPE
ncbi:hypothetical protein [Zavarzinia sp. CC-PAN008]|uniref:hypothetical protein n=1 Tax=Zavarzinia sp. CC-PAN008 TaxID=3243332 RepID=UPI003F745640